MFVILDFCIVILWEMDSDYYYFDFIDEEYDI